MARVALYARYSSEGQREASIEDQYRNCEQYAERQAWQVVERYEDKGISGTWTATTFHGDLQHSTGMLNNPVYIGRVTWNRREWVMNPETKRRVPRVRPESEWIITEQPHLRIIPQELWDRVQERRKALALGQLTNGQLRVGRGPKFLLSGLLKCDECGSNFVIADYYRYACGGHLNRGASVCTNGHRVSRKLVEERCLAGLKDELLTPETIERIIQKATRLLAARSRERQPELERTQRQLAKVEGEIANIMKAIKAGILTASTKAELEQAEAEQSKLQETIKRRETKVDKVTMLLPGAQERIRALVNDLASLSNKHVAQAREQLRELIGEIRLVPKADDYLEAVLNGRFEGVLKLAVGTKLNYLVAGRGFEPLTFGL